MQEGNYVFGIDYGSDSVRGILVDIATGTEIAHQTFEYPRWKAGKYCDATSNMFRQHPLDYLEGLDYVIKHCLAGHPDLAPYVRAISIDTTGSTPCAVDRQGRPLALSEEFAEDVDAMFILWKDHTAIREAEEINALSKSWKTDYTAYSGGIYSSEWFWAKILHTIRRNPKVAAVAYSWVEHCDWIPYMLVGGDDVHTMKRSRTAAGHKAMWHASFDGLPSNDFLKTLDPLLDGMRHRLYTDTYTCDQSVGHLHLEWAQKWGLSEDVVVGVGGFDAHMGAVGGEIEPYYLSKVMGTSTCDILIVPASESVEIVKGICGQVDGSVLPNCTGLEAGQSGFGDIYAWFRDVVGYGSRKAIEMMGLSTQEKAALEEKVMKNLIAELSVDAMKVPTGCYGVLALDWLNGRRTPDANQSLKGCLSGLNLGSTSPVLFRALVESTCYGARAIVERFESEGIPIKGLIGLGGVAKKSPFIMQIMADVMNRPIRIARSEQTCALGAAMFAATISGYYPDVETASKHMGAGFEREYIPHPDRVSQYQVYYEKYLDLAKVVEHKLT
ncbi:ribulokinase [Membranihabitans marinus]|uniref:ribulokinase n=1 Tax=Membranihabitans marinus TaxID=1227546 RepID=UPI001F0316CA|nr:ribulokinase [Membranihabitans marinus]